jgi:thiosulfate/3-mercaptopyruvate sulfurtransferase
MQSTLSSQSILSRQSTLSQQSTLSKPSPLVSTQWLADYLGSETLVILDATVIPGGALPDGAVPDGAVPDGAVPDGAVPDGAGTGHERYLHAGHVPGAVFADLLEVFSDPDGKFPYTRPSAELFELAAESVGIDNDTTVVVYDSALGQWAARLWWLFRSFGYDNVSVLNGGLVKWLAEGRASDLGHVEPRIAGVFTAEPRPELWADKKMVEESVAGTVDATLVCALPAAEFSGASGTRPRLGHIPGSINLPVASFLDRASNTFLRDANLESVVAPLATADRIITYCGGGIAAGVSALALVLAGHTNVAVYDGSLNEWSADEDAPLVIT